MMTVPTIETTMAIHRTTMFKIPNPDNQKKLVDAYRLLEKEQSKDGKPWVIDSPARFSMPAKLLTQSDWSRYIRK